MTIMTSWAGKTTALQGTRINENPFPLIHEFPKRPAGVCRASARHAVDNDIPAHLPHAKTSRKVLPVGCVEHRPVDEAAGVVHEYDAVKLRLCVTCSCTTLFCFLLITLVVFFQPELRHTSFGNQLTASLPIQFCPVTPLPARAEPLKRASFVHFLEGAVYPSETQCFHHCIHIADDAFQRTIPAFYPHPHLCAGCMVFLKPLSEFLSGRDLYDVLRFHLHIRRNTLPCVTVKVSGYIMTVL